VTLPLEGTTAGWGTPVKTPSSGSVDMDANADLLNPLTMSQMPSANSQKNSGAAGRTCHTEPSSMTPIRTAAPEAMIRGPPMSPSKAILRGTKPERYIR
jgi:hypothetical protein